MNQILILQINICQIKLLIRNCVNEVPSLLDHLVSWVVSPLSSQYLIMKLQNPPHNNTSNFVTQKSLTAPLWSSESYNYTASPSLTCSLSLLSASIFCFLGICKDNAFINIYSQLSSPVPNPKPPKPSPNPVKSSQNQFQRDWGWH